MQSILVTFGAILGAIYVLFLPGFVLSYVFFSRSDDSVDIIERLAISFALSVAVVPLVVFYLNMVGIKISRISVLLVVPGIILLALAGIWLKGRHKTKGKRYEIGPRS